MARKGKVVRFASSTKPGSSDNAESSNNTTPSPIPELLTSSKTKPVSNGSILKACKPLTTADKRRTATKWNSNPIVDPLHAMVTRSRHSKNDPSESPSPKRPRRGRTCGHGPVIYSERWHPMDDILSPKRAAKVKAKCGKPPDQSDSEDQDSDTHDTEEDTEEESTEDQELSQVSDHAPSPGCRRSSRKLSKDVPNYDVRFHPTFDKALRPASARAALVRKAKRQSSRRLSTDSSTTPSESECMTTDVTSKAAGKAPSTTASPAPKLSVLKVVSVSIPSFPYKLAVKPSPSRAKSKGERPSELPSPPPLTNLRNPHLGKTPLDYNELGQFDQLIYSLQKGAPVHGNTLPLSWQTVKQTLFDCGEITLDELNDEEATKWLQLRYECLRLGIEAFFKSKPETADKNEWTLSRYEEFDAFDKNPDTKYWKHHRHSIFSPSTTSMNDDKREPMEIAETDDEKEAHRGQEEATPYNQFDALEDQLTVSASDDSEWEGCETDDGGLEEDSNHVDEIQSQERETTVIDLEHWRSEDDTLVETMQGEEVVSSEGLMSHEELGKTIADFMNEPLSNPHVAKVPSPSESNTNSDQPLTPAHGAPESSCTTQASSIDTFSRGFQAVDKGMEEKLPHEGILLPVKRSKKRKAATEPDAEVEVHEDAPGGSPRIRRIIANNPPSPGTDLPKENLPDEAEHSSQVSVRTPQTPRFHWVWGTSTSPFRSLFGGPPGVQSPST
ncbi:hypothetical protein JMJ35_005367 [Cladonia borealis]|uniref:Uncharacterized protein n=1 Tax=Cladonia borealis TaxID=184061 RepID=A0AA39R256_9LECA|nr:hypothetical protein JMJ35_005367 [Cladonia borealis]